jgi:hypothetical protein
MLPLVEIPELVRPYAPFLTSVFSPEAFKQFQRSISGLMVSENKTVEGINRIFVLDVRNQSSLNRVLTESPFSVDALHKARVGWLERLPGTQMKPRGVLSLDDTLLTHYGKSFEKSVYLYDPAQACYVWAHNLVNRHDSDDQPDYPVYFPLWEPAEVDVLETGLISAGIPLRTSTYALKTHDPKKWRHDLLGLWRRHQQEPAVQQLYQSKLFWGQQLLTQFFSAHPERQRPVTFDHWYTQPAWCRFLHQTLEVPYVGTFAGDDGVIFKTGEKCLDALDRPWQDEHHHAIKAGKPPVFGKITIPYKGATDT